MKGGGSDKQDKNITGLSHLHGWLFCFFCVYVYLGALVVCSCVWLFLRENFGSPEMKK